MISTAKRLIFSPRTYLLVRVTLGLIFLWSGAVKLVDPKTFAVVISKYGLVPDELLVFTAFALPVIEVLAGLGVIFNIRGSLAVILALLGLFLFVLWYGILHDLDVDCGCFSLEEHAEHGSLWAAFFRDWVMVGAVFYLWGLRWRQNRLQVVSDVG